jgi:drug/metabolite transporter (DMT)-like permease
VPSLPIGELAGLGTAVLWVVSTLAFTAASRRIGATKVNLLRTVGAAAVLVGLQVLLERNPLSVGFGAGAWLAVSGVIGLAIGDQCLFTAYVLVGPRVGSLLMTLAPGLTAILAWLTLGESMSGMAVAGLLVTTAGVGWVSVSRAQAGLGGGISTRGIVLGVAAAACQAGGMLTAKLGMSAGLDALGALTVRMVAAVAVIVPLAWCMGGRSPLRMQWSASAAWGPLLLGTLAGPVCGVYLSLVAIEHVPLGVATTLMGLVPVLILPVSRMLHKERISTRAVLGAIMAVAGLALLTAGARPAS